MRLTRRGYGAVAVVLGAIAMAWLAGPRTLNALAAPVLVALLAGAVQLKRASAPSVERTDPRRGFPGERRTVDLAVDGSGVATIEDDLSEGLSGDATGTSALPTTLSYEVTLTGRGDQTLGPVTVTVRDALGLVETTHEVGDTTSLLVYPRVSVVDGASFFARTLGPELEERTEFDQLREYVPGDRLRDVHWKSTAKYDELLVTKYTDPVDDEAIRIVAEAAEGHADAMADATASLVVGALRVGLAVELEVPARTLERGFGQRHQFAALEMLARTGPGTVASENADVHVRADAEGVTVRTGERTHAIDEITVHGENPLVAREGTA